MVNVGGPSKGCVTCIQRKIRCDRQRPVCGQCQKSSRQCGGYRKITDIMFRDQSQKLLARANADAQRQPAIVHPPRLNAESGLITFFANNFTCSSPNTAGTNLFWLPSNFEDLLKADSANLSVQSVGAMALARLRRSNYYHREAQKKYGLALLNLAELWRQQVEIDKDTVLITILFLSFFEILASYEPTSRQSWTTHLASLGFLLKRRDEQFLTTDFGARMLLQSRSQAILNALQTQTPIAEAFQRPNNGVRRPMPPQIKASHDADMLLIRLATLQAQYRSSGPSNALIAMLTLLDGDFCQWTENLPPSWSFSIQPSERRSELWWEMRCDVYSTAIIAHVWNKIRTARIVTYDLIQEVSLQLLSPGRDINRLAKHQRSHMNPTPEMRRLIIDICATIPTYYRPSSATAEAETSLSRPLLGTTYWLLWPLEVMGSMKEAPLALREWVLQCLTRVHDTTGILKAQAVADRLTMKHSDVAVA